MHKASIDLTRRFSSLALHVCCGLGKPAPQKQDGPSTFLENFFVQKDSVGSLRRHKLDLQSEMAMDILSSSDTSDGEDGAVRLQNGDNFIVNEEYARRFEHNKKREELRRCMPFCHICSTCEADHSLQ
jgi:hypothetical protein